MDKKAFKEVENMMLMAKAKAYSNISLQRELTDREFEEYKKTCEQLGIKL